MATSKSSFGPISIEFPTRVGQFGVDTKFCIKLDGDVMLNKEKAKSVAYGLSGALLWNTDEQNTFGGALSSFIGNIARNSAPGATYVFERNFEVDMKLTRSMKQNLVAYAFWLCVYIYEDNNTDLRTYLLRSKCLPS